MLVAHVFRPGTVLIVSDSRQPRFTHSDSPSSAAYRIRPPRPSTLIRDAPLICNWLSPATVNVTTRLGGITLGSFVRTIISCSEADVFLIFSVPASPRLRPDTATLQWCYRLTPRYRSRALSLKLGSC